MNWQDWNPAELAPALDAPHDLERAKQQLDEFGYVILENLLSKDDVQSLRTRLDEQAAAERALGLATLVSPASSETLDQMAKLKAAGESSWGRQAGDGISFHEQFVVNLLNKGEEFWPLLLKSEIQELVAHILGQDFLLSSWLGTIVNPGCPQMGLHTDQWYMNSPHPRSTEPAIKSGDISRSKARPQLSNDPNGMITPSYSVQTIWMLTDFDEEAGATRIVPKSNRSGVVPEADVPHPYRSIPASAPAGSVLIYDARIWHSSAEHNGATPRYALHGTIVGPQIRQMENYFLGILPEVRRKLPQRLLEMMGYKIWWGYGRVDDLSQIGMIDPDHVPVGRLELSG